MQAECKKMFAYHNVSVVFVPLKKRSLVDNELSQPPSKVTRSVITLLLITEVFLDKNAFLWKAEEEEVTEK